MGMQTDNQPEREQKAGSAATSPIARLPFMVTVGAFAVVILTMGGALSSPVVFQAAMWLYFLAGPLTLLTAGGWPRLKRSRAAFVSLWFIMLILLAIAIPSNSVIYGILKYEGLEVNPAP